MATFTLFSKARKNIGLGKISFGVEDRKSVV